MVKALIFIVSGSDLNCSNKNHSFNIFNSKVITAVIGIVSSTPQFFGQSFSSSSFVDSTGQVVSNSIYTDSDGNKIVNGKHYPKQAVSYQPARNFAAQYYPSNFHYRPDTTRTPYNSGASRGTYRQSNAVNSHNSGAYVHDNRGQYRKH